MVLVTHFFHLSHCCLQCFLVAVFAEQVVFPGESDEQSEQQSQNMEMDLDVDAESEDLSCRDCQHIEDVSGLFG